MNALSHIISTVIDLSLVNGTTQANPNSLVLNFTTELLDKVATSLAGLHAMNLGFSVVTISLPDDLEMYEDGELWIQDERDPGEGNFDVSSIWMKVQSDSLVIEIWDEHGSDELHGSVNIKDVVGLSEELERRMPSARAALLARLS